MISPKAAKVGLALFLLLSAGVANAALVDEIRARIQPHGAVCVMGDLCAAGVSGAAAGVAGTVAGGPKQPEQVYQTFCFACHTTGANNSPIMGNIEAWEPRIAKGMDALYENSINGFNNGMMPPKGLCMDCTNEDLQAVVDYMVQASQ